jgi:hypothetical protein
VAFSSFAPLLVVEDVIVGRGGVVLLPAVPREGLPLCVGDCVDVLGDDDERREVEVIALEPDHDASRVRIRIAPHFPIAPGFEVWASQSCSHVVLKRPGDARSKVGPVPRVGGRH